MTDYAKTAREMRTSSLIAFIAGDLPTIRSVIDADGDMKRAMASPQPVTREMALEEFDREAMAALQAVTSEIDRRIPIPEGQ